MKYPVAPRPSAAPERPRVSGHRLRGRSLSLARTIWTGVAVVTLVLFVAGIPAEFAQFRSVCTDECADRQLSLEALRNLQALGLSKELYAAYAVALDVVFASVYAAVAALIFWRRPDDRMALFVSLALLTFGTATFADTTSMLAAQYPVWRLPVAFLQSLGSVAFGLFLYLFPNGRFVPSWTRWVALL